MRERIHSYLDGELPTTALSDDEIAAAAALQETIRLAVAPLAGAETPDLTARVMAAIPPVKQPWTSRVSEALSWLWAPRPITLRPAYGVALVALLTLLQMNPASQGTPVAATAAHPGVVLVQFRLDAPEARKVSLAGSFTGWRPDLEMTETAPGVWTLSIPLETGVHDYQFVIDGEQWVADPVAQPVDDGFGGTNSRLFLPTIAQT